MQIEDLIMPAHFLNVVSISYISSAGLSAMDRALSKIRISSQVTISQFSLSWEIIIGRFRDRVANFH